METLGKLFGSEAKVKILRLFLFNPESIFDTATVATRIGEDVARTRRELSVLEKISFVKRRAKKGKHGSSVAYVLNQRFSYLAPLQNFLTSSKSVESSDIIRKLATTGNIKLILVAGTFIKNPDSRVDLLLVGDNIVKGKLAKAVKGLEALIGVELRYAYFTSQDFLYRLDMYDKLIRDVLDYPHQMLVNKFPALI